LGEKLVIKLGNQKIAAIIIVAPNLAQLDRFHRHKRQHSSQGIGLPKLLFQLRTLASSTSFIYRGIARDRAIEVIGKLLRHPLSAHKTRVDSK
jgi:hypothetical protein